MAHVMDYQEILDAAHSGKIIYDESRTLGIVRPLKFDGTDFVGVKHHCYLPLDKCDENNCIDYNMFYRCWDEEPSEELKEKTPWKDSAYGDFL